MNVLTEFLIKLFAQELLNHTRTQPSLSLSTLIINPPKRCFSQTAHHFPQISSATQEVSLVQDISEQTAPRKRKIIIAKEMETRRRL